MTDSGWGYTIPPNILCWTGGTLTQNQSPIRDFRRLDFSGLKPGTSGCNAPWTDVVFAGRWRKVACPKTYSTRTKANGDLECWKLPPECTARGKVANPITLLDGCKVQRETDYRSRTPGGVEVERFYNSGGYFRFDVGARARERCLAHDVGSAHRRASGVRSGARLRPARRRLDTSVHVERPGNAQQPGRRVGAAAAR